MYGIGSTIIDARTKERGEVIGFTTQHYHKVIYRVRRADGTEVTINEADALPSAVPLRRRPDLRVVTGESQ